MSEIQEFVGASHGDIDLVRSAHGARLAAMFDELEIVQALLPLQGDGARPARHSAARARRRRKRAGCA